MTQLGVAIFGCGKVAAEHIEAFLHDGRAQVRALVNRTRPAAERYRERYQLDCVIESDFRKVLVRDDIDAVVVATPHHQHAEQVVAAAEAGKHILIEKPAAIALADLRREQAAVREAGVKTLVSFVLRWNPLLQTVDRLLERQAFGQVFMVEVDYLHRIWANPEERWLATRGMAGSAILAGGCHAIDALRWFARSEATEVSAYQVKTENPIEYPGTIVVSVKFENGIVGRSATSFDVQMPYRFNIGVYGTEGTLRNNQLFSPRIMPGQTDFAEIPSVLPDSADVAHHPFEGEISSFINGILEDPSPTPNLEDAAKTHEICFAADISATEMRPVKISELG